MSAVLQAATAPEEFFAPSNSDALDVLLGQYQQARQNIEAVASFMQGKEVLGAAGYFFEGNKERFNRYTPEAAEIFRAEPALAALNARYWQRALDLTDVMDYMPDARRQEWHRQIQALETPEFEEKTVRATLATLLSQRMDFLAEMVDGIFRGLSGEHVTNQPQGFSKRMIIQNVISEWGYCGNKAGLVHDLRCVIAKFMGRDQVPYDGTRQALEHFRRTPGEWHIFDGGALRVRVYKNGNGHMEVHPDLAWRLNQVLAHLHPQAIPASLRQKPKSTRRRDFALMDRPLPFAVLKVIGEGRFYPHGNQIAERNEFVLGHTWKECDKHVVQAVGQVLEALGGTFKAPWSYRFDYDASSVIAEVLASGVIPDHKSHQYYPTPRRLAEAAVRLAEIEPGHRCLEPSAGQGALAELMPLDTVCVEASQLHCAVLEAKGFEAVRFGDFLNYHPGRVFDRIVMNPPFSQGRAKAHVEHAASMLVPGGRLVAILPASFAGKDVLPGFVTTWSEIYANEFAGTSVDVVMLTADAEKQNQQGAAA